MVRAPTFSPPNYAIWVNSLWLSSLAICLTSAFLATLLQQWTRRSIDLRQPFGSPDKRAQVLQFFNGVDDFHIQLAADAVPTLLHLSVLLFLGGLLILLRNINVTVFNAVIAWVALAVVIYTYVTFLPISRPASTDYSPLSSLAWQFSADMLYVISKLINRIRRGTYDMGIRRPTRLLRRLEKKAEEIVLRQSLELDARILDSLLDTVGEDDAQETFFEAMPDFYKSRVQKEGFKEHLSPYFADKFCVSVNRFLSETLSSDWVSESTRSRRLLTCLDASHEVLGNHPEIPVAVINIANRIIRSENWKEVTPSPEIGRILRRWRKSTDTWFAFITSCIIAQIIAGVGEHDDTWRALTMSQLGVTKKVLRSYLEHGDSVFLANLINTTRLFMGHGDIVFPAHLINTRRESINTRREPRVQFQDVLRSISEFNVQDTLLELQHDFCALWNEIVVHAGPSGSYSDRVRVRILRLGEIRRVYDALHHTAPTTITTLSASADPDSSLQLEFPLPICTDSSHRPTMGYTGPSYPPTTADTV